MREAEQEFYRLHPLHEAWQRVPGRGRNTTCRSTRPCSLNARAKTALFETVAVEFGGFERTRLSWVTTEVSSVEKLLLGPTQSPTLPLS